MQTRRVIVLAGAIAAFGAAVPAAAQFPGGGRYPGGMGGMGGMGHRMGGMGNRRFSPSDVEQRFKDMGSLKPVLKNIKLQDAQKDSLKRIEKGYAPQFEDYGKRAADLFQQGGTPDRDALDSLRTQAGAVRDQEFSDARAVLTSDQQPTFDDNVSALKANEEEREQRMHQRMGDGSP